ncbi:MAG TPA: wax ester/triacylglycerol synthase domain-containing protein [Acidimicrobiales bacterium]|nr:wax ester/triacylglycerol synthase domain-containing protein [Acidimicrobiales bacterium]
MREARQIHAERRMSDVEAMMWNLEKDPHLSASVANLTLLDRSPDRARLRARMQRATEAVPRLRQRVVPALGRLAPPEWREDPELDLDYHLRWMGAPGRGTRRDLLDLVATLANQPFDRTRPLWEFVIIEGLEGGKAAMLQKLHHTITDGEGGIRMSEQFIDLTRDATEPITTGTPSPPAAGGDLLGTTLDTLTHNLRRGAGIAQRAASAAADAVTHPGRLGEMGADGVGLARSVARQLLVTDHAHSPLWTERSLRRQVEILQIPFDPAKAAAKALGGSLNDFLVTAAAGAAGVVHRAAGCPVDELRISMPVSTRTDASAGGNAFIPTRVLVPAGIEDPVERFAAVHERLAATKAERAIGAAAALAGLANLLPTSVLVRLARQQVETVDFAVSNVRGAPFPLYIAGAFMEANHPLGPVGGTAWNLTLMTYSGHMDMGLHVDRAAVEDPTALRDAIEDEAARLVTAGAPKRRRAAKR